MFSQDQKCQQGFTSQNERQTTKVEGKEKISLPILCTWVSIKEEFTIIDIS